MPLLRQSLYSQNVNLYLAPTADGRDTWLGLLRTIAVEGRCVVLSANQCLRGSDLPDWITGKANTGGGNMNGPGTRMPARLRRKSTIECEDGHEIALPILKQIEETLNNSEWAKAPKRSASLRRKSTVECEDGHEIVLPLPRGPDAPIVEKSDPKNGTPTPARLRRQSTITEDGNEIALPSPRTSEFQSTIDEEEPPKLKQGEFISWGGSCIISPFGEVLAGPLWEDDDGLLVYDVDFDDCLRGRLDLDVGGSYSR